MRAWRLTFVILPGLLWLLAVPLSAAADSLALPQPCGETVGRDWALALAGQ